MCAHVVCVHVFVQCMCREVVEVCVRCVSVVGACVWCVHVFVWCMCVVCVWGACMWCMCVGCVYAFIQTRVTMTVKEVAIDLRGSKRNIEGERRNVVSNYFK